MGENADIHKTAQPPAARVGAGSGGDGGGGLVSARGGVSGVAVHQIIPEQDYESRHQQQQELSASCQQESSSPSEEVSSQSLEQNQTPGLVEGGSNANQNFDNKATKDHHHVQQSLRESDRRELNEIRKLLWGNNIRTDVFKRWSQGFVFSEVEPSALVQKQGGPCAVIAPVQAYLLKILLNERPIHLFKDLTTDKCRFFLIQALCNILKNCKVKRYRVVSLPRCVIEEAKETVAEVENAINDLRNQNDSDNISLEAGTSLSAAPVIEISPEDFHRRLQINDFNHLEAVEKFYKENFDIVSGQYGVLLFMYSVFLTKGIDKVNSELLDTSEPLIHNTYGYGSQALINLMLTGRAVAHVWDHDQNVDGLKLCGINEQSDIGFITLMEQMRYCTVGSFFKNPRNPVWVMGSETHLTVLFSHEKKLVAPESPSETARRVFKSYDPDGNNFISTSLLKDVLADLDLVSEQEYVDIMVRKLDPEGLDIILLNAFMEEFFAQEKSSIPDTFDLFHYNGIPGSNEGNKVQYSRGKAIMLESDLKMFSSNPMMTCLQTKWPNIEINWEQMRIPSLN